MDTLTSQLIKGAHFLFEDQLPSSVYTPEDFTEEQKMIRQSVDQFIEQEFMPVSDRLEAGEHSLNVSLLKSLGELGFLGTHMPETYGGLGMDTNTNTIITEALGRSGAFSTTYGAHTGIGMLPILYYGNEEQKNKYLPALISGEKVACYCLTEPGSGSDALAAKTRADLSEDGKSYIINGQKMWISNAGFADVFIVFAKINGTDFSCFILEKEMEGLKLAAEEKKMGIKGSSTRQVFFENVHVPVDNLLGEAGKGHLIAFNVLNAGRYRIGPAALGGSKSLCDVSIAYANERLQFGRPISSFGAIKSKIALQATDTFVGESAVYRTSGLINEYIEHLEAEGKSYEECKLIAAEEYALESSILKVAITDKLNEIASECVQIHGGMGYSEEAPAARAFRDARISMIYEGTNEINRLLMANLIFKRAMKGQLDFSGPAMKAFQQMGKAEDRGQSMTSEEEAVYGFKQIVLLLLGALGQKAMSGKMNLKEEQEIVLFLSDIIIETYLSECVLLRVQRLSEQSDHPIELYQSMLKLHLSTASHKVLGLAEQAFGAFTDGETLHRYVNGIHQLCSYPIQNTVELRRTVADYLIEKESYVF